jgi:hypothetical protein
VAAKRLWNEIINDRPADWFRPGSFELLERYCELTVERRNGIVALRRASDAKERGRALRQLKDLESMLAVLARQLRLSVQADVDRRAVGKLSEKGDGPADGAVDRLLGGDAVWGRPQ